MKKTQIQTIKDFTQTNPLRLKIIGDVRSTNISDDGCEGGHLTSSSESTA